jgi:hypothetical protein
MPVARSSASKPDRDVDVVAQHRLAGREVARQHGLDRLLQERLAEGGIALGVRLNGLLEISGQRHGRLRMVGGAGIEPATPRV